MGIKDFTIHVRDFEESDTDPLAIEIRYKSLVDKVPYLEPRILVEISSRSLRGPFEIERLYRLLGKCTEAYPLLIKPLIYPQFCLNVHFWKNCSYCMRNFRNQKNGDQ